MLTYKTYDVAIHYLKLGHPPLQAKVVTTSFKCAEGWIITALWSL